MQPVSRLRGMVDRSYSPALKPISEAEAFFEREVVQGGLLELSFKTFGHPEEFQPVEFIAGLFVDHGFFSLRDSSGPQSIPHGKPQKASEIAIFLVCLCFHGRQFGNQFPDGDYFYREDLLLNPLVLPRSKPIFLHPARSARTLYIEIRRAYTPTSTRVSRVPLIRKAIASQSAFSS